MWVLLLPLPWLLIGALAAGWRRRRGPGCVLVGVLLWPQSRVLEGVGISPWAAWGISLAVILIFPVVGYWLGLRLWPPQGRQVDE